MRPSASGKHRHPKIVSLVAEQVTETVGTKFLAEGGLDPAPFQIPDDLRFRLAAGVALINLTDNGGFFLIHIEPPLGIDLEAQAGVAAIRQALFGIDGHAPMDLLRKLHGIIFRHTFQNALHNDANVLALGAGITGPNLAKRMVEIFLSTEFEGGRHARRVALVDSIQP